MKNLISGLLIAAAFLVLDACNKYGLPPSNGQLAASSLHVAINQPDSLKLVGAGGTDTVKWSIAPAGFDSLVTSHNEALVFFKKAGTYTITALDRGVPASIYIKVSDSVYHNKQQYVTVPFTGDQITLVPYYHKSVNADSTFIYFIAQTKNYYCGSSNIKFADSVINGEYNLNLIGVTKPAQCGIGSLPLGTPVYFDKNTTLLLANGSYPLSVTLNGTTYTGSFDVTSSAITFNWDYTAGVLVSPKQISR